MGEKIFDAILFVVYQLRMYFRKFSNVFVVFVFIRFRSEKKKKKITIIIVNR